MPHNELRVSPCCTPLRPAACRFIVEAYRRYRYNLFLVGHNSPVSTVVPRILPLTFIHHRWQLTNSYPEVSANQARSACAQMCPRSKSTQPLQHQPRRSDDLAAAPAHAHVACITTSSDFVVADGQPACAQVRLDFSYFEYPNIEVRHSTGLARCPLFPGVSAHPQSASARTCIGQPGYPELGLCRGLLRSAELNSCSP